MAHHYRTALSDGTQLAWPDGGQDLVEVKRSARLAFLAGGAAARKRLAIEGAADLHRLAVELAADDEERATALEELGDDYDAGYDGDQAVPAWQRAIALCQGLPGSDAAVARMAMKTARMGAIRWGGFSKAMEPEVIDRFVDIGLASSPDPDTLAWLLMMRAAYVSAETLSPDTTTTAEIFELPQFVDRNFQVRLKTYRRNFIPSRRVVFQSPDEGAPPGTERLIWSQDGRYLLLVGKKVFPRKRECLSTGELLYLLYDNQKGIVSSSGLSLADLSGIDFTEKLFPGALAETRSENAPPCKVSGG